MYKHCIDLLESRRVKLKQIAEISYDLQLPYNPWLKLEDCLESVISVLNKREVQHTIITGIYIDILTQKKKLPPLFQEIMQQDDPLYGLDEILALSITNLYGSIALTNFGYLDKSKMGILSILNNHHDQIHVFLDDIIAGIAAAASARLAHSKLITTVEIEESIE